METDDPNFICDLPSDLNFGGETIGILYADVNGRRDELVSEYGMGVVADAVYERNILVEEQLGLRWSRILQTETCNSTSCSITIS